MNKYQKTQHQAAMKIFRHIGVSKDTPGFAPGYKAIRKTLRAMSGTIKWMEKRKKKDGVDFGELQMDYREPGVVRIIIEGAHGQGSEPYVLTEIRRD